MIKKQRCPRCGSSQTRARIKTMEMVCNDCANVWKINKEETLNGST